MHPATFTREVERKAGSSHTYKVVFEGIPGLECVTCARAGRSTQYIGASPSEHRHFDTVILNTVINLVEHSHKTLSIPFPSSVALRYDESSTTTPDVPDLYRISTPTENLSDLVLSAENRALFHGFLTRLQNSALLFKDWNIASIMRGSGTVALFHGPSGTGKTLAAKVLANTLQKPLLQVNYASLESKYVGDTPKNIVHVLAEAERLGAMLLFDEADSVLSKRVTELRQAADYGVNLARSVLLVELEKTDTLVVFTTNLLGNIDTAFRRRIGFHLGFDVPGSDERRAIWERHLPAELPRDESVNLDSLARASDGFTGGDIQRVVLDAATLALAREATIVSLQDFLSAIAHYRRTAEKHYSQPNRSSMRKRDPTRVEIDPKDLRDFLEERRRSRHQE